jgi:hypothetical protein
MADSGVGGSAIGVLVLTVLGIIVAHLGAYALLERSGWYHPPHHYDDGICACDMEAAREHGTSPERARRSDEDTHINGMGRA